MQKFSELEKLVAVQQYVDGNESCMEIANSLGMEKGDLLLLIKQYEYHGVENNSSHGSAYYAFVIKVK